MHFTIPVRYLYPALGSLAHFIRILSPTTAQQIIAKMVDKTTHFLLFGTSIVWAAISKDTAAGMSGRTSIPVALTQVRYIKDWLLQPYTGSGIKFQTI
jgi:hypothetical protein